MFSPWVRLAGTPTQNGKCLTPANALRSGGEHFSMAILVGEIQVKAKNTFLVYDKSLPKTSFEEPSDIISYHLLMYFFFIFVDESRLHNNHRNL